MNPDRHHDAEPNLIPVPWLAPTAQEWEQTLAKMDRQARLIEEQERLLAHRRRASADAEREWLRRCAELCRERDDRDSINRRLRAQLRTVVAVTNALINTVSVDKDTNAVSVDDGAYVAALKDAVEVLIAFHQTAR